MTSLLAIIKERFLRLRPNTQGALWALMATVFYAFVAVIGKDLGARYDPVQISFFRCLGGLIAILPFLVPQGVTALYTRRIGLHLVRGGIATIAIIAAFYAIVHLPLASSTALDFTKPLFMIFLAVLWLGETVRWRRWSATVIGFIGVLVMVRPGLDVLDLAILAGLLSAAGSAVNTCVIKKMTETERQTTVMFYFGVITTTCTFVPALLAWRTPSVPDLGMFLAMGAIGTFAQSLAFRSYSVGEATVVVPVDYSRLIFALLFGVIFFAELPDLWSLVGAVVIIGSTLYITLREAQLGRKRLPNPPMHQPIVSDPTAKDVESER